MATASTTSTAARWRRMASATTSRHTASAAGVGHHVMPGERLDGGEHDAHLDAAASTWTRRRARGPGSTTRRA